MDILLHIVENITIIILAIVLIFLSRALISASKKGKSKDIKNDEKEENKPIQISKQRRL